MLRITTMAAASVGFLAGFAAGAGLMAVRMGEQPISTAGEPGCSRKTGGRSESPN